MSLHREIHFETEICRHLAANGWLHDKADATRFDRANGLFMPDLLAWTEATQPESLQRLAKTHGAARPAVLAERVRKSLNERGTLDVLRRGVEMLGLKEPLMLAQFKPALAINPAIQAHYAANRLRVVRQVCHSPNNPTAELDLVLFLNGIAVATVELKSDFTQSVHDAVDQYRFDRHPQPRGGVLEPLLGFPGGALVHFAVSQSEVMMATRLAGPATAFLPFNRGNAGGAGNAPNPAGFATAYLWEEVWARESWLDILHRYLIGKRDDKKRLNAVIFPRYHQLDATRKLVSDVRANGPGQRYLIQHSAGSGKTNSGTTGVVASITNEHGSKSAQLSQALKDGKKIIVCTIQTFPFALAAVQELAATEGKRFAVIADEAHSSQTGESAAKLKQVLSAQEWAELQDGGEIDAEALLAAQMEARTGGKGLTYIAFTATPKAKTLELFGRPGPDGLPQPFHVYSMRQAIEEGFILDVLQNYISYKLAFRLAHGGEEYDEQQVERSAAMKGIMQWVRLHPYNIAQKVQTVVEHYRENVQPLLAGRAKAMIVVGSRKEAVRWQKAIRSYIDRQNYSLGVLVAFSGEVNDPESYVRLYAFLSQIFDYGNTAIEKRFLFYKRLIPLLEFGRERDIVDLSKVVLTHHTLKNTGKQPMTLNQDGSYKLPPMDAVGSGSVQEKQQAYLNEIIDKVNGLFEGELTDDDQLVYVNGVLKGKLLENQTLVQQAASNSKEQFANSPDLKDALLHAIMDALEAHNTMSTQALGSERVRDGLRDILLGPGQLYEGLRERSGDRAAGP